MAFFKFRKGGDEQAAAAPPESIEAMRKRARYRLLGAAVLVIAGVIGFPLLFDKQPRPIAVDMTIDIPDKNKVKPMVIPAPPPAAPAAAAPAPVAPAPVERKQAMASGKVEDKPAAEAPTPAPVAKPAPEKVDDKAAAAKAAADVKAEEAARAQALLEGKSQSKVAVKAPAKTEDDKKSASNERYVVQVGAFADVARAREVRMKVERAGMKTYTQVVDTGEGKRIRVRVGPFTSKAEVNKVAEKIKKLDLPAAVLTL